MRLAYGVGVNDKKSHWNTKEYFLWNDMLRRCYSKAYHSKKPTYIGCEVSENFKSFSYFYDWCQNQIGFGLPEWDLDKDILIKGNKVYSEDNCVFVPNEINSLLVSCERKRGEYPIGVCFHKRVGKFNSKISIRKKRKHIGYFDTPLDAFIAYKAEKEKHIKEIVRPYLGSIDDRAYKALMNYTVEITD